MQIFLKHVHKYTTGKLNSVVDVQYMWKNTNPNSSNAIFYILKNKMKRRGNIPFQLPRLETANN